MTRILLISVLLCAGCDIHSDRPDFELPATSDARGTDWPQLAATPALLAESARLADESEAHAKEADRLATRAQILKARAVRLRATQ